MTWLVIALAAAAPKLQTTQLESSTPSPDPCQTLAEEHPGVSLRIDRLDGVTGHDALLDDACNVARSLLVRDRAGGRAIRVYLMGRTVEVVVLDGVVHIVVHAMAPRAAEVGRRAPEAYGLAVDARFTAEERTRLAWAFEQLTEREREVVGTVKLTKRRRRRIGSTRARTSQRRRVPHGVIEVFGGHRPDPVAPHVFGDPAAPHSEMARLLLHEIGHLLAYGDRLRALRMWAGMPRGRERRRLGRCVAWSRYATWKMGFEDVEEVPRGLTDYAMSGWSESFAEAFSLFKLQPAWLASHWPETHRFFAEGRHVEPIRFCGV